MLYVCANLLVRFASLMTTAARFEPNSKNFWLQSWPLEGKGTIQPRGRGAS